MAVDEQCRAHVVPGRLQRQQLAAFDQGGAFFRGQLQVLQVLLQLAGFGHRTDLHPLFEGVADLQLTHACNQCLDKTVVDTIADNQPRRGGAFLPGTEEGTVQRAFHGDFQVSVIEHHQRILAAHFQLAAHQVAGRGNRHSASGGQ
ncbi:hypothetical protein D3C86_1360660 [compost metagenome]